MTSATGLLTTGLEYDTIVRDPQRVLDSVLDGLISVETAQRDFGVVVNVDATVDVGATARARAMR